MKTIKGYVRTNRVGSESQFEFQIDDDLTEEEIEECARESAFELIEWNFTVEKDA